MKAIENGEKCHSVSKNVFTTDDGGICIHDAHWPKTKNRIIGITGISWSNGCIQVPDKTMQKIVDKTKNYVGITIVVHSN